MIDAPLFAPTRSRDVCCTGTSELSATSQLVADGPLGRKADIRIFSPEAYGIDFYGDNLCTSEAEARDLSLFARVLRQAEGGRWVIAIFIASTVVTIANMFGQVQLNDWNGRFFDAVGRKDLSGFVRDLRTFIVIIAILLALTVANTFLQEHLKFRLREWITRHLLAEWLKPLRVYQLNFAGEYGHNPDQRIQEDTRLLGDYTADLGCGIVYSLLQLIAFVGMLWTLRRSGPPVSA